MKQIYKPGARAWEPIENMDRFVEPDACEHCGSPLFDVATAPLPEGRVRKGCTHCKQRFNVALIVAHYLDFGSY
jgi:hypothetical protein